MKSFRPYLPVLLSLHKRLLFQTEEKDKLTATKTDAQTELRTFKKNTVRIRKPTIRKPDVFDVRFSNGKKWPT